MAHFSTVAHCDHVFCSPISSERADRIVELLDLPEGGSVIDIGCGKAELLLRIARRYRVTGIGVDPNGEFLGQARRAAEDRGLAGQVEFHETEAARFESPSESFDAAVCVGASHAYGTLDDTLAVLSSLVRPGGSVLVGDLYWKRTPHPEYLAAFGDESVHRDHRGNVELGVARGLTPLYSCVSSEDEWDHYEGLYNRAVERYAAAKPDDPEATAFRERIRAWRDLYLRFGRETLGFGFYLFRKPH